MIDLANETPMALSVACAHRLLLYKGKPLAPSTIWRYVNGGCRVRGGGLVKLETVRLPSGVHTTEQAIIRFIESLTMPASATPGTMPRSPSQIRKAQQRAATILEAAGIRRRLPAPRKSSDPATFLSHQ